MDDRDALVVVGVTPGAEHHRAEAQGTDFDSGGTELSKVHARTVACGFVQSPDANRPSRTRSYEPTVSDRWPSSGSSWALAPATCSASQRPWSNGTIRSWPPCQIVTGLAISSSEKPQSCKIARSSSNHPQMPLDKASLTASDRYCANSRVIDATSTGETRSPNVS